MYRKIEIIVPHFFLGFTLAYFVLRDSTESLSALGIAALVWVLSMIVPRFCPLEKPTKLEAQLAQMEKSLEDLNNVVQANAEYSAKEFGTVKNVLQIKQMGLR